MLRHHEGAAAARANPGQPAGGGG
eukprot:SAG22_NODE_9478_length_587_cov_4.577869_1_plen_23_part_01